MPTYRLDLAYDGSGFHGYARQSGQPTVQGELETALETILETPVTTSVAGRTDAGVHAHGQVASFHVDVDLDLERLRRALNGMVGPLIAVMGASEVGTDFDARHSATWRRYRYLINTGGAQDPLTRHIMWHARRPLDLPAMNAAAAAFIGEHDFTTFCRSVAGRTNVRQVTELTLSNSDELIEVWMQANAFCHQMVRSVVGYLYDVGRGFSDGSLAAEVIEARDRAAVATVAPPHGLTLWAVGYESRS